MQCRTSGSRYEVKMDGSRYEEEEIVEQSQTDCSRRTESSEPLSRDSPIPLFGRAGFEQSTKLFKDKSSSPANVGTKLPMADKPGSCTYTDKEATNVKMLRVHNCFKIERLTRSEARKLSPGQPFNFVLPDLSPILMCPPTSETGGHNIGTITLSPGNNSSEGYRSASTGTPVAIVRPWESYAVESWRVPPWHPPSVRTSRFMHVDADNNFQVGQRTCKSANLKIIGSRECSIFGNIKSKAGPSQPKNIERPTHDDTEQMQEEDGRLTRRHNELFKTIKICWPPPRSSPCSHLCSTPTPLKPVYFRQPHNLYMHECIYKLRGGQGRVFYWFKPAESVRPGLGRGDTNRGDVTNRVIATPPGPRHSCCGHLDCSGMIWVRAVRNGVSMSQLGMTEYRGVFGSFTARSGFQCQVRCFVRSGFFQVRHK